MWEAIPEATQGELKAVWVLGGGQDKRLTVDQFVLEDGQTYRTVQTHDALLKACRALAPEDPEALAQKVFGENHAASMFTKERNNWKPTPVHLLEVAQAGCVEHGHGGLWNAPNYHINDVVSIDMHSCYPTSFMGKERLHPGSSASATPATARPASPLTAKCQTTSAPALHRSEPGS